MVSAVRKVGGGLPAWIEANIRLPARIAADPGPVKLYSYQRGIAAAVGDPQIERVHADAGVAE